MASEKRIWRRVGVLAALSLFVGSIAVLNIGGLVPASTAAEECGSSGGGSPSPSPSESDDGGLPIPTLPIPGDESPSPSPSESNGEQVRCESSVTISFRGPTPDRPRSEFRGAVSSQETDCERGRRVIVKKVRRGPDRSVGNTLTNRRGRYVVRVNRADGRYYAKATRSEVAGNVVCLPARSRTIRAES